MEQLRIYTIKDLKDWILEGNPMEGLSEAVITKTRAFAFINNPYVTDDMPVVSTLYVDEELAAFTAAFPERLARPDCLTHWINSLYVSPKHEGKGYALFVLGSLLERYEDAPIFDLDAMDTSVEILKYLGLEATTFTRHIFREKSISRKTLKGRMVYALNLLKQRKNHSSAIHRLSVHSCEGSAMGFLSYDNFIDKEAYDFIATHSESDFFLRSQESLNWMLHYPFVHEAPLPEHSNNLFSSSKTTQRHYVVKAWVDDKLVSVYILCETPTQLRLEYLYYDPDFESSVMCSIMEHIVRMSKPSFTTTHPKVAEWTNNLGWYPIHTQTQTSFCYPKEYHPNNMQNVQGGDGDMLMA